MGGINILSETEIDASSELAALMDDETGTGGLLVFSNGPTLTGTSILANSSTTNATTSTLYVTSVTSALLKTGSTGGITAAVAGTDYESNLTAGDGLTRTLNDFDCDTASASVFGCLSSSDWSTFNSKLSAAITSLNGLSGAAQTFATTTTLSTGFGFSSATTIHTLNIPPAGATTPHGLLTAADWSTFNSKLTSLAP